ncbi:MAG: hypothetical protein A3B30_02815 [Candidatus Komeilibacteria bacterium RIFCSPLOWO2_01_FULL_52_15]|uniref:Uncharacterized protein n=2 Tax=Candidatus Komeiliibacteriota TaxID=1817908 RepID=A0A1G2BR41_9BACT|nr:MAG: hypothetical protein A2677_02140 [Candidatus Komeilibacteria bacterium RIFCSPHIGHO2_01_FULL_52_14]OGY90667.1 MAG: hypothetical protein A3B30_02815 [Candidatus Komeilibacteria bacterium RIFCSPLOWO2_01_FULL_52_15]
MHVQPYSVKVYYEVQLEAILRAGFDEFEPDITSEHFPAWRLGVHTIDALLIRFDDELTPQQALLRLEAVGFRGGTPLEVATLGKDFPHLQERAALVAPLPVWSRDDGGPLIVVLDYEGRRRRVKLASQHAVFSRHSSYVAFDVRQTRV